jgi:hypothetical protein
MVERIEAKRAEAAQQIAEWQRVMVQAKEQLQRWGAIRQFCDELLATDTNTNTQIESDMNQE